VTTRHVSAENAYPFVEGPLPPAAQGIVDLWFVVNGPAVRLVGSSSSSAGPEEERPAYEVNLVRVVALATETKYMFRIRLEDYSWKCLFTVPHGSPSIGIVKSDSSYPVMGVLTYNGNNILKVGKETLELRVEPSRVGFYHEAVTGINFLNIKRCDGVESEEREEVLELGAGEANLNIGNGYNMEVSVEDGALTLNAQNGNGLGNVPSLSFGNTDDCADPSSSSGGQQQDEVSLVRVINGITPDDGNVVVNTSRLIGKEKAQGLLKLILRRA
jgi:hypothetical protein